MNKLIQLTALFLFYLAPAMAQVNPKKDSLGDKPLRDTALTLQTVTITAAKSFVVQKNGNIVLNVAESPIAAGGRVYDVLKRAPGVTIQNGELQFRGKKVTVLLDGRHTNLDGEQLNNLLTTMVANGIATIELIPNPSARYDAKGGAVINIISAKNKKFGINGSVTAGIGGGFYGRYNGGLGLNYRNQRINAFGNYDYQHQQYYSDVYSNRSLNNLASISESTYAVTRRDNHSFKGGFEYAFDSRHTIGVLVRGVVGIGHKSSGILSALHNGGDMADSFSRSGMRNYSRIATPSINIYYKAILDSSGRELNLNADYFTYNKNWNDDFTTRYYDPKGQEYTTALLLRDQSPARNTVRAFSADYSHPFKGGKLEGGLKTTFTTTDNDIRWEQQVGGAWETDTGKTNHFIYRENILAAYMSLGKTLNKWGFQGGLRVEQTNTTGDLVTKQIVDHRNYFNIFPTAAVTYDPSENHSFSFSYRKSIQRFQFDVVNPFIAYQSQYSYYQGNPAIRASIAHNFEISHAFKNQLFSSIGYAHYTDALAEVFRNGPVAGSVISSSENVGTVDAVSANISWSKSLLKGKWSTTNSVSTFYGKYNTPQKEQNDARVTANISSENIVLLPKGFKAEVYASYTSPMIIGVFRIQSVYSVDLGLSKSILQGKGNIAFNVSDVFNTDRSRYEVRSFGIQSFYRVKKESRFIKLVFTCKFGNRNVKVNSNRKTGVENESRRMGS